MRWMTGRRSSNIEDRRGMSLPIAGGGIATVVALLLALFFGVDPGVVFDTSAPPPTQAPSDPSASARGTADPVRDFVAVVLADTEDTWAELFRRMNREYRQPRLVLFSGAVQSACGMAGAAVGPFYCPPDQKLYLDLSFFRDLRDRFRAPGDFAQAYVIAHEVGHHVQTLLGVTEKVAASRGRGSRTEANALSVRQELQADCFAGVWAHHANASRQLLEPGDIEEGLAAAAAIGDDRLQRQTQGRVVPESFTHGSSTQRVRWFKRGLDSGQAQSCDTFTTAEP
ncbi:MAG: KPN_02809 family neutral zinc metallopeptidase [Vicinamibacterales bacterium]